MRLLAFAIHDRALSAYGQPMFFPTEGAAMRAFADAVNDPQSGFAKHPEDYDLYRIGVYDDFEGRLESAEKPVKLSQGRQVSTKEV